MFPFCMTFGDHPFRWTFNGCIFSTNFGDNPLSMIVCDHPIKGHFVVAMSVELVECCFTSAETVGLLGTDLVCMTFVGALC